jgi:hypothetical protein
MLRRAKPPDRSLAVSNGWLLLAGRRRFGRVLPDGEHAGMWRSLKSHGVLSDMASLPWAKNAALAAAECELEFEGRQLCASDHPKCPGKGGAFSGSRSPMRQNGQADVGSGSRDGASP